jgi:3-ketosteroid 9alpha-monooxygenase subunit B
MPEEARRMTDRAAAPSRLTTFVTTVRESIVETPDTRTLVLDITDRGYLAGQYVSIDPHQFPALGSFVAYLEQQKRRTEPPRAYSMCSAPHEPYLAVTVKEEVFEPGQTKFPPLLSGFLVHSLRAGDPITVQGYAGGYTLPPDVESSTNHVLHLVAGSGSVPNFSMVKDSLHRHQRLKHTFIYSNKLWEDVIFRDALDVLEAEWPSRLRVIHRMTRGEAPDRARARRGRVDAALLQDVLTAEPESLVYACGPAITVWERRACAAAGTTPTPRFLETMLAFLAELGVPRSRVRIEALG